MAAELVRGGVTAATAMQYEISDRAAVAFARGFYGAIARDRGVDEAVSSGRVAILGLSGKTLEWVTPVLYLRGDDSRLFTVDDIGVRVKSGSSSDRAIPRVRPSRPVNAATGKPPDSGMTAITGDGVFVVGLDIKPGV